MGKDSIEKKEAIGLIPAAGRAVRISPLPCSKEIYPIGFKRNDSQSLARPKGICEYLLEPMRKSGVKKAFLCFRSGKWDILSYLKSGSALDMHLAYLVTELPFGVPYTVDAAFPFIKGKQVVFGFPDTIFQPDDAFTHLMKKQLSSNADIVLGLFPALNPQKVDMVRLDDDDNVCDLQIKPSHTDLKFTWIIAVWEDTFTRFLHDFVTKHYERMSINKCVSCSNDSIEIHLGEVIQAAIKAELNVENVIFRNGSFLDIGTIEDMVKATQDFSHL
jgi:glucose-1-phosphate thymidylyltransferase